MKKSNWMRLVLILLVLSMTVSLFACNDPVETTGTTAIETTETETDATTTDGTVTTTVTESETTEATETTDVVTTGVETTDVVTTEGPETTETEVPETTETEVPETTETEAPETTETETTEVETTEAVEETGPYNAYADHEALYAAAQKSADTGKVVKNDGYVSIYGNGRSPEVVIRAYTGDGRVTGEYMVLKYRFPESNTVTGVRVETFLSCNNTSRVPGDNTEFALIADGQWHITVLNMAEIQTGNGFNANADGTYTAKYVDLDILNQVTPTTDCIDVAFFAIADNLEDVCELSREFDSFQLKGSETVDIETATGTPILGAVVTPEIIERMVTFDNAGGYGYGPGQAVFAADGGYAIGPDGILHISGWMLVKGGVTEYMYKINNGEWMSIAGKRGESALEDIVKHQPNLYRAYQDYDAENGTDFMANARFSVDIDLTSYHGQTLNIVICVKLHQRPDEISAIGFLDNVEAGCTAADDAVWNPKGDGTHTDMTVCETCGDPVYRPFDENACVSDENWEHVPDSYQLTSACLYCGKALFKGCDHEKAEDHSVKSGEPYTTIINCSICGFTDEVTNRTHEGDRLFDAEVLANSFLEGFVTSSLVDASGIPYAHFAYDAGTDPVGEGTLTLNKTDAAKITNVAPYVAVLYRKNFTNSLELFATRKSELDGAASTGYNKYNNETDHNKWHLAIFDCSDIEKHYDNEVGWMRLDIFNGAGANGQEIDLAYVGFFTSAEEAREYYAYYMNHYYPDAANGGSTACDHEGAAYTWVTGQALEHRVCPVCGNDADINPRIYGDLSMVKGTEGFSTVDFPTVLDAEDSNMFIGNPLGDPGEGFQCWSWVYVSGGTQKYQYSVDGGNTWYDVFNHWGTSKGGSEHYGVAVGQVPSFAGAYHENVILHKEGAIMLHIRTGANYAITDQATAVGNAVKAGTLAVSDGQPMAFGSKFTFMFGLVPNDNPTAVLPLFEIKNCTVTCPHKAYTYEWVEGQPKERKICTTCGEYEIIDPRIYGDLSMVKGTEGFSTVDFPTVLDAEDSNMFTGNPLGDPAEGFQCWSWVYVSGGTQKYQYSVDGGKTWYDVFNHWGTSKGDSGHYGVVVGQVPSFAGAYHENVILHKEGAITLHIRTGANYAITDQATAVGNAVKAGTLAVSDGQPMAFGSKFTFMFGLVPNDNPTTVLPLFEIKNCTVTCTHKGGFRYEWTEAGQTKENKVCEVCNAVVETRDASLVANIDSIQYSADAYGDGSISNGLGTQVISAVKSFDFKDAPAVINAMTAKTDMASGIVVRGWVGVNGGVSKYAYRVNGGAWIDCDPSVGFDPADPAPYVGAVTGRDQYMDRFTGNMVFELKCPEIYTSYKGQIIDITYAVVPAENTGVYIPMFELKDVYVPPVDFKVSMDHVMINGGGVQSSAAPGVFVTSAAQQHGLMVFDLAGQTASNPGNCFGVNGWFSVDGGTTAYKYYKYNPADGTKEYLGIMENPGDRTDLGSLAMGTDGGKGASMFAWSLDLTAVKGTTVEIMITAMTVKYGEMPIILMKNATIPAVG